MFFKRLCLRCTFPVDKNTSSLAFQGVGDIKTDRYQYLSGTAPQNADEVAITYLIAGIIDADIGDTVFIKSGEITKEYIVTAIYQSMNNMGRVSGSTRTRS